MTDNFEKFLKIIQPYYQWRIGVMARDNYCCRSCGKKGRQKTVFDFPKLPILYVDHIKPFCDIIKEKNITSEEQARACVELWDISNGETFCIKCFYKNKKRKVALKFLNYV